MKKQLFSSYKHLNKFHKGFLKAWTETEIELRT